MQSFLYARPESLDEALNLLAEHGSAAKLLAGGTDLMVRLQSGHAKPRIVIDLKRVKALRPDIAESGSSLRIGARAVMADIAGDRRIQRLFPALVEAANVVGSVQIRNRATLAGNICNASPAADTASALLVYGAIVNIVGSGGARQTALADFFQGPGRTHLGSGEIVESIDLPLPQCRQGAAFGRITRRKGVDLATINLCCLVTAAGDTRFAYGAVGPRPFLAQGTSSILTARERGREALDASLKKILAQTSPISDVRADRDYREAMLLVMSRRALETAIDRLNTAEAAQ